MLCCLFGCVGCGSDAAPTRSELIDRLASVTSSEDAQRALADYYSFGGEPVGDCVVNALGERSIDMLALAHQIAQVERGEGVLATEQSRAYSEAIAACR